MLSMTRSIPWRLMGKKASLRSEAFAQSAETNTRSQSTVVPKSAEHVAAQ